MPIIIWTFARIITFCAVIDTLRADGYLDKDLHNLLEGGHASDAIALLISKCENTVDCDYLASNESIVYELIDFQSSPGPVFTQVDKGVLYSVKDLTPTNAIYVLSPSSGNITLSGRYEQNLDTPGEFTFLYTLGPNSWLRSCAYNYPNSQLCTEWKTPTGGQQSTSGKEILNFARLGRKITLAFEYHCKDVKCLMLVRELKLFRMKRMADTPKEVHSYGISEKSIEFKTTASQSFLDTGSDKGPDLSSLLHQIEQNEKTIKEGKTVPVRPDEVFTFTPPTTKKSASGKGKRPRRPTPPPVTERSTTPESTTCRSTTLETTTVSDEDGKDDDSLAKKKQLLKQAAKAALIAAGIGALGALIKFLLMLAAAEKIIDGLAELGEELKKEKDSDPVMYVVYNLFQAYEAAPDSIGLWLLPALLLSSIPYGINLFWNPAMNGEDMNPWKVWQGAWHESILILRSHGPEIATADLYMSYSPVSLPLNIAPSIEEEGRSLSADLSELANKQLGYLVSSKKILSEWELREGRNGLRLNIHLEPDWYILTDLPNQQQSLRQTRSFDFSKNFKPYVTYLTKQKPQTILQSIFFKCQSVPGPNSTFILRYQMFAHSPDTATEICVKKALGGGELCVPSYDAARCHKTVCVADLAPYQESFLEKDIQVIIRVKAPFDENTGSGPSSVVLLLASPDYSDMFESESDGQFAPCYLEPISRSVDDVFPRFTHFTQVQDCEKDRMELKMIVATRVIMIADYEIDGEIKYDLAGFRTIGDWYESDCLLNFASFENFDGPPELLLLNKSKPFSVKLSGPFDSASLEMDTKFICVAKQIRVSFYISTTIGVSADVCVYNTDNHDRYHCSQTNSIRSYGYPTMLFESNLQANRVDLHVKINQDNVQSGSATFMMKKLEVIC